MTQLIVFRALQGVGAGGFLPLAQIIIADIIPPAERPRPTPTRPPSGRVRPTRPAGCR